MSKEESKTTIKNLRTSNPSENSFFIQEGVDECILNPIEIRFEALILERGEKTYDWYNNLKYDKGFASKVRRGLLIPKHEDRIKISKYFGVDSSTIWRVQDLDLIKKILRKQIKQEIKEKCN